MPELHSALAAHLRAGRFGAAGEPRLILSERPLGVLMQLAGWRDSFEQAARPVLARLGLDGIGSFDRAQASDKALAFRIAPERLLLQASVGGDLERGRRRRRSGADAVPRSQPFAHRHPCGGRERGGIAGAAAADRFRRAGLRRRPLRAVRHPYGVGAGASRRRRGRCAGVRHLRAALVRRVDLGFHHANRDAVRLSRRRGRLT